MLFTCEVGLHATNLGAKALWRKVFIGLQHSKIN
jgi:hypothetical protein